MTARLTAAEARALGIVKRVPKHREGVKRAGATTRCHACAETFATIAAEDRHSKANPTHHRFDLVWS